MSSCLEPQTSPEKAFRGSKNLLRRYLEDFGRGYQHCFFNQWLHAARKGDSTWIRCFSEPKVSSLNDLVKILIPMGMDWIWSNINIYIYKSNYKQNRNESGPPLQVDQLSQISRRLESPALISNRKSKGPKFPNATFSPRKIRPY